MIKIVMSNSEEVIWQRDEYDSYIYDGKFFIIKRGHKWIGMYNLDYVISVIVL